MAAALQSAVRARSMWTASQIGEVDSPAIQAAIGIRLRELPIDRVQLRA